MVTVVNATKPESTTNGEGVTAASATPPKKDKGTAGVPAVDAWVEPPFEIRKVPISEIVRDRKLKMRADSEDSPQAVHELAAAYQDAKRAPEIPLGILYDVPKEDDAKTTELVLVDAWHRSDALVEAKISEWDYRVSMGTRLDAAKHAARANVQNKSVRWGEASERNVVRKFIELLPRESNRVVAAAAGVHESTVRKWKTPEEKAKATKGADGKTRKPPTKKPTTSAAPTGKAKPPEGTSTPPKTPDQPPAPTVAVPPPPEAASGTLAGEVPVGAASSSPANDDESYATFSWEEFNGGASKVESPPPPAVISAKQGSANPTAKGDPSNDEHPFALEAGASVRLAVAGHCIEVQVKAITGGRATGFLRVVKGAPEGQGVAP